MSNNYNNEQQHNNTPKEQDVLVLNDNDNIISSKDKAKSNKIIEYVYLIYIYIIC